MAMRKKDQMINACDTCGAIGYAKELVICNHCKNAFRHSYCMNDLLFDVTMRWNCDDCPKSLNEVRIHEEIMLDNKDFNVEDNRRKALLSLGNQDQIMANKFTSEDNRLVSNAKNDKQSNVEVSGITDQTNKKVANASAYSASTSKDPGTSLHLQKMAPPPNLINSKEKLANYHDQPCWKGTFEILDGRFLLPPYQGLRAHLSCVVNPKVVNLCKNLSEKIEFKELPLSKIWPKIFMLEPPNTNDVALYFFCDPGRPREKYTRLVQRLDSRDHALKAKMMGTQLLLFSSKKLPINSQNMKNGSYLWGIIHFPKTKVIFGNTNVKLANSTSKTKKQTKFDLSNIPPEKRSADINKNGNTNVPKSCLVKKPCLIQSENTTKNVAKVISLGKQEKEEDGVSDPDIPPGFSKKMPIARLYTKFEEVKDKVDYYTNVVDTDLPPGFSNFLPSKQQMNVQLRTDFEKGDIVKNKDVINKVTNSDDVDPDIPPGFSYAPSAFKSDSIKSYLTNTADNRTDPQTHPKNDTCTETSSPLCSKHKEVDMSIENETIKTENSDMSIDNEDETTEKSGMSIVDEVAEILNVDMPFNSSTIKKDFLIPNIGPPPGFPEIAIKNGLLGPTEVTKCIVGAKTNNSFSEGHMESIGAAPCFPEVAVKRNFILPTKCTECLQGVKNGTCSVESDVKVSKVNIKNETLEYSVMPVFSEPCHKDMNLVRPNFDQSPLSKDATSTMIRSQKAPVVCAKASENEIKSGENSKSKSPLSLVRSPRLPLGPIFKKKKSLLSSTKNGCETYDNNLSWMNRTMKVGVPNDAENGIFTSNVNAQSEESGKTLGKTMFGVKFSLKKADKPSIPVAPIFLKKPLSNDNQITPESFKKTHISDTDKQATDCTAKPNCSTEERKSTRSSPLTEQCFKNHYISKNPTLSTPLTEQCFKNHYISKNPTLSTPQSVKGEGRSSSVDKYSTPNAEKARDASSRTVNPESVSEVRRILLDIKKSRELKGKK